jgi:hypothetical protein
MNIPFFKNEPTDLDQLIDRLIEAMDNNGDPASKDYAQMADQLVKLKKIRTDESRSKVSTDALLAAGVNLAGILLVIYREQTFAITSKAFGFIAKTK